MSQSIFDWDEDEEQKEEEQPEQPAALIPYQPEPVWPEPPPVEYQPEPFQPLPASAEPQRDEPAPFEYYSDPFQQRPEPVSEEPDPFAVPEFRDDQADPFWNDADLFGREQTGFETPPEKAPTSSPEETARRSGLAFSAGIVFFSSVVFMLFLGWIADWLIGSSPWGLVGGIVLGSVIGLIQFVRITSQIFNTKDSEAAMRPLMPPDDEH